MPDIRKKSGGRGLCGGPGKRVDGVFPGLTQSFRHQRRPVNDCSPGREGMAQDGGTRGGTFHDKMDRCSESQGWSMVCSRMHERDGKNQGEDNSKQADSCWFTRHCRLATRGANLYASGAWLGEVISSFSGVWYVLFCFGLYDFIENAALRSIVL